MDYFIFQMMFFVHQRALRTTQSSNYHTYICPFARTCSYFNSFVPRTIRYWNTLPSSVTTSVTDLFFTRSLREHIY